MAQRSSVLATLATTDGVAFLPNGADMNSVHVWMNLDLLDVASTGPTRDVRMALRVRAIAMILFSSRKRSQI